MSGAPVASVTARAPAKINLQLAVGAPGPDGYHELATVFHAVGLYDELTVTRVASGGVRITVEGESGRPGAGGRVQPGRAGGAAAGGPHRRRARTWHLHLHKGIPVAGGMAGGSADAAAALVAADLLWRTGLNRDDLQELGAELGADVPFALIGGTALGTGRGDRLTPALARGDFHWVLAVSRPGACPPRPCTPSATGCAAAARPSSRACPTG